MPSPRHALRLDPRVSSEQQPARMPETRRPSSYVFSLPKEVTAMLDRVFRALSTKIDAGRIEAHRAEVHREMSLMLTLR